jgi:hypothetical protein
MWAEREREYRQWRQSEEEERYPEGWWQSQLYTRRSSDHYQQNLSVVILRYRINDTSIVVLYEEKNVYVYEWKWIHLQNFYISCSSVSFIWSLLRMTTFNWSNIYLFVRTLNRLLNENCMMQYNWTFSCRPQSTRRVVVRIKALLLFLHNHLSQISSFSLYSSLFLLILCNWIHFNWFYSFHFYIILEFE